MVPAAADGVCEVRVWFGVRRKRGRDSVSEGEDRDEGRDGVARTSPRPQSAAAGGGRGRQRSSTRRCLPGHEEEDNIHVLHITPLVLQIFSRNFETTLHLIL
jgi:hypothetical protein